VLPTTRGASTPEQRAEVLKERIYATFTSLAVVMTLSSHADELTPAPRP